MGDKPDDVPSLEELGDDTPLPNYWTESTTITVDRWVKELLDKHRDGRPWNQYLEKLRAEHADPITFNDVAEIADQLKDELSMAADPTVQPDVDALMDKLDRIESAATTAEERTNTIAKELEEMRR